jgi:peptidoglycan/xylan/chitin deacetylase (PgdA/CDA1 family)
LTTTADLALPPRRLFVALLTVMLLALTACVPTEQTPVQSPELDGGTPAGQETSSPPPTGTGRGLASISFDDGTIGQYEYARPVLRKHKLPATYYLVSDALGWGSITISPEQARELRAEGNEIGNHTKDHKDLADLTAAQVRAQFAESQDTIETQVGVRPTTCAYPYGSSNAVVLKEAEKHFKGCRSTQGGLNERDRLVTYDLFSYYVLQGTTAAQIRAAAERARASNLWIVFVYHDVDPEPKEPDDVTPELFAAHIDAITSTDIPVRTVESALAAMSR